MKFVKGTLAALATATALGGQPAAADGLNLNLNLDLNGNLRGGSITLGTGNGITGNFNFDQFDRDSGAAPLFRSQQCNRNVDRSYNSGAITRGQYRDAKAYCRSLARK